MGGEILAFVKSLFRTASFPTSINTTWVTLIPKCEVPIKIDDFRLVSMIDCLYKII